MTFLPQFIMGAQGMPRRYYNYIDQFTFPPDLDHWLVHTGRRFLDNFSLPRPLTTKR